MSLRVSAFWVNRAVDKLGCRSYLLKASAWPRVTKAGESDTSTPLSWLTNSSKPLMPASSPRGMWLDPAVASRRSRAGLSKLVGDTAATRGPSPGIAHDLVVMGGLAPAAPELHAVRPLTQELAGRPCPALSLR